MHATQIQHPLPDNDTEPAMVQTPDSQPVTCTLSWANHHHVGVCTPHDDLGAHVIQSVRALDNQLVMFTLPTITVMLTLPIITPG